MILVSSILSITGTPSNGSLPIGNGQGFTVNTLTAGANVTITNGPGTITIAASGGGGTPAGSTNEIQYNNSGAFGANSNLAWDIANNRAIIGTEVVASPNSRCVIIGKGGGTNQTFAVHNNTGINNSLVVNDNGFVGFGATPYSATLKYRFNVGTNANLSIHNPSGTITRLQGVNDIASSATPLHLNGDSLIFEQATNEYVRLDSTQYRIQNTIFNVNQSIGSGGAVSLLNLNNTNNQVATSILNFTIAGGNLAQLRAEATAGDDNVQIRVTNSSGTLIEPIRFQGSGNVLIGTTTDVATSILTLSSTTKGLLLTRMTTAQKNTLAAAAPTAGTLIYDTTLNKLCIYTGAAFETVTSI